jgi:pimeloyl-ACP methyl ester carboxylesterase
MNRLEVLFLHALPLNGAMWDVQRSAIPVPSHAPTLYGFGKTLEEWAQGALCVTEGRRLVLVGCSVGGSCALEIAALAPEQIAGLMLIGTKADCRPDPEFLAEAIRTLRHHGRENAWERYWRALFAPARRDVVDHARSMMMEQSVDDLVRGVEVFHTRPSRAALLPHLHCPVAIVTGEHDLAPGIRTSRLQADAASRGTCHVVEDCGHYVPLERPQVLNDLLRDFLSVCQ